MSNKKQSQKLNPFYILKLSLSLSLSLSHIRNWKTLSMAFAVVVLLLGNEQCMGFLSASKMQPRSWSKLQQVITCICETVFIWMGGREFGISSRYIVSCFRPNLGISTPHCIHMYSGCILQGDPSGAYLTHFKEYRDLRSFCHPHDFPENFIWVSSMTEFEK